MNTEYTPGPWLAFQANSENGTNYWRIRTAPPWSGDTLRGYCGEANARLIAAAPDLLEALKLSLIEHKEVRGFLNARISRMEPVHKWLKETEQVIGMIESAIAKAEGKA